MIKYKIYALKLKDCDSVVYVGLTSKTLLERFKRHIKSTSKISSKNGIWIINNISNIEIILIEDDLETIEKASKREVFWIKHYTNIGYELTNGTLGGSKGYPTDETRNKLSECQRGKITSQETKDRIRNTLNGYKQTIEHIENVKLSKINYKHSDKARENIGNGNRYKPQVNSKKFEVYNYKTNEFIGVFETQTECANILNIKKGGICSCLSGRYKQHKGYYFKLL